MMSETASELLAAFDSLPPQEQHELVAAMLRRSGECPDALMPDEGFVALADHLFQMLDLEESRRVNCRVGNRLKSNPL